MYVTLRNDSGAPLNDVTVSIVPVGRQTIYNKFIGRLENSESRNVMLGDFLGRDGTPFSLRVVKPRSVELKGKDVKGKDYSDRSRLAIGAAAGRFSARSTGVV